MKVLSSSVSVPVLILLSTASIAMGQVEISVADFRSHLRSSNEITKTVAYRTRVTVETGETQNGSWTPYSSFVSEYVFPDRLHLTYTSQIKREIVKIGKFSYQKEADEAWRETAAETPNVVKGPASPRTVEAADRITSYYIEYPDDQVVGYSFVIRIVSKLKEENSNSDKKAFYYSYCFDKRHVLLKHEMVGFNGKLWVHTAELYEYDPDSEIEAPIPN